MVNIVLLSIYISATVTLWYMFILGGIKVKIKPEMPDIEELGVIGVLLLILIMTVICFIIFYIITIMTLFTIEQIILYLKQL